MQNEGGGNNPGQGQERKGDIMFGKFFFLASVSLILAEGLRAEGEEESLTPEQIVRILPEKEQAKARRACGPSFRAMETDRFRVISDCSFRYQRVVNGVLELFYREFHQRFFVKEMKQVTVYLIHDGEDFKSFVKRKGHGRSTNLPCFYDRKKHAIYARHFFSSGNESGIGNLFHVAVYPMINNDFRKPPPDWFSAGLAALCECGRIIKGKWIYGNPNPWREAEFRHSFEKGTSPRLETLLTFSDADFRHSGPENVNRHAARSFFLYLLRSDEEKLAKLVSLVREGMNGPAAVEEATGKTLEEVEKEWEESIFTINFAGDYAHRAEGDDAMEILKRGLEDHPENGYLHYKMADLLTDERKNTQAAKHVRAALEDPRFIYPQYAYELLGQACLFGKATKAIEAFQAAITYQPWEDDVMEYSYEKLAWLLEAKKRKDEAAEVLKELERLKKEDERG